MRHWPRRERSAMPQTWWSLPIWRRVSEISRSVGETFRLGVEAGLGGCLSEEARGNPDAPIFELVLRVIQRIHKGIGIYDTGPWLGGWAMGQQVCVVLSAAEREQLAAIVADRNPPREHVERGGLALASSRP